MDKTQMDVALLVKFLAPCLPFLLGLGQKAMEKGAEKLGEKGIEGALPRARKLWEKLLPQVGAKEAAQEAAEDVAKNPEDGDALAALRQQLKKILEAPENAALMQELTAILADDPERPAGGAKFNVPVQDSQVGAIGDGNMVTFTQNIGTKS